jgi:hypothetical protein
MWDLDNSTDYGALWNWVRDKDGTHCWLVAVRGTFDILPSGELVVANEQPPPPREPQFRGDPATSSLVLDSDLLSQKPGTDIVLDAVAYAPQGRPTKRVEVSLHVAELSKTLIVHGPRVYVPGLTGGVATSSPRSFITQPIHYESDLKNPDVRKQRMDIRNPVGKGVAANERDLYDQPAHVVEYPGEDRSARPAGFGPVASFWSPRRERAGTYDAGWQETKKPLLPDDYDPLFAFSAPEDQRLARPVLGGELVVITNMSPEGVLRFRLPDISLIFRTHFGSRRIVHAGSLTTVLITPHTRRLSMIWQSALPVPALETDYLDFTFIAEEA